jgi:CPA1 family monovalent cation:H+ antiporter
MRSFPDPSRDDVQDVPVRALEIVVVVLVAVLLLTWVSRRLRVNEPVLLLVGGVLIGLLPPFRRAGLPPAAVLLIFLPPLLYAESLTISLHQIRENLRVITLLAVGLVLATAATVAATAHGLGLSWPMAIVLGAVIAPTDATAVANVARGMPRRMLTTLRAESLINDGAALALFAVAVDGAVTGHQFGPGTAAWRLAASYAGGIAIGVAGAWLVILVRRHLHDLQLSSGLSVLTPFAIYLPAEAAGVSGVLAVVVAALILSRASPLLLSGTGRVEILGFWRVTTFLLNGSLFVLIGIQLPHVVRDLRSLTLAQATLTALAVSGTVIVTRLLFVNVLPYVLRALDRRPQQVARRVPTRQRAPGAWGGVRGAVSLAAALAVPTVANNGARLAGRDVVVFATAVVIVVTLLVQGQTMPAVIRWARMPPDPGEDEEERLARRNIAEAARDALDEQARRLRSPREIARHVEHELAAQVRELDVVADHRHAEHELRFALLAVKRASLVALRDARRIDDAVLRRVQEAIDAEELRLRLTCAVQARDGASGTATDTH